MSKIKIVTDSTAGLTDEEIVKNDINIIPLSVMIDDTVYTERETITNEEFYEKMKTAKGLPKTSQPPLGKFINKFDKLGADGSEILSINLDSKISGTYKTACEAANLSKSNVKVIDSLTTDRSLAFQVLKAAEMSKQGKSINEIIKSVDEVRKNTKLYMGILNLDNIVKGGRLKPWAGAISNLLNIKVIVKLVNGEITVDSKGRGLKSIHKYFTQHVYPEMQEILKHKNIKSIGISYVGSTDFTNKIKDEVQAICPNIQVVMRETVPIIATYGGLGAFALMYYSE
ncbi:DegV family protein [Apilactobacillus micheneri]|uniref:DegV family protein n=1 Tax=Apilactobacillus micheneri TaxID=1899430 RepID=UPI000D5173B7|nr:DegV family protein [Apilactobacillus micheneri]GAY79185.1 DegV domain-containing protein [Apilactobacillus micheneri]